MIMLMLRKLIQKIKKHKYKILGLISLTIAGYYFYNSSKKSQPLVQLSSFFDSLKNNNINQVVIDQNIIHFRLNSLKWSKTNLGNYPQATFFKQLKQTPNVQYYIEQNHHKQLFNHFILPISFPLASIILLYNLTNTLLNNKKKYKNNQDLTTKQNFNTYFGGQQTKLILKQIVQFLKQPQKYQNLGLRNRKGILFYGPPGTGKTLMARIFANQCGLPFLFASGSEFVQIYVGNGAKRVRQLFQNAKKKQNGCIIFIDQIDSLGSRSGINQHQQISSTINELLNEMDGFIKNEKIVVIAATNNLSKVDPALLRSGRFDLLIQMNLPTQNERIGIFKTLLTNKNIKNNFNDQQINTIASNTNTYKWSGADLQNLINQSGFKAFRQQKNIISFDIVNSILTNIKLQKLKINQRKIVQQFC